MEELEKAKKDIENAIEMKKYEKIFTESQPGILKIMNLHVNIIIQNKIKNIKKY